MDHKLIVEKQKLIDALKEAGEDASSDGTVSDAGEYNDDDDRNPYDKKEEDEMADMFGLKSSKVIDPYEEMRKKSAKQWLKEQKAFDQKIYQQDLKNDRAANKVVKKADDLMIEDIVVTDEDLIDFDFLD